MIKLQIFFFFFFFFDTLASVKELGNGERAGPGSRLTWSFTVLDSDLQSLMTLRRNDLGHALNQAINSKVLEYG